MTRPRSLHTAFGLTIASEVPLIDLPPASVAPDVDVSIGSVDVDRPDTSGWTVRATPDVVRGWIPSGGAFEVRDGARIVIDPAPDADVRALRLAIVGPLLGVLLTQRRQFVLHASSVAIDDVAVACLGPSGCGKSTLTAALTAAGHPLVADDITVVDLTAAVPTVLPGIPRVKLWPDSASALQHDVSALPVLHPEVDKRSLPLPTRFHADRAPLRRCYVLEEGEVDRIEPLGPSPSVVALIGSTYHARWLRDTGAAARNLQQAVALAGTGVVRTLRRRRTFAALADVVRLIEQDVRGMTAV